MVLFPAKKRLRRKQMHKACVQKEEVPHGLNPSRKTTGIWDPALLKQERWWQLEHKEYPCLWLCFQENCRRTWAEHGDPEWKPEKRLRSTSAISKSPIFFFPLKTVHCQRHDTEITKDWVQSSRSILPLCQTPFCHYHLARKCCTDSRLDCVLWTGKHVEISNIYHPSFTPAARATLLTSWHTIKIKLTMLNRWDL